MFFVNLGIIAVTLRQLVSIIKICRAKVIPTLKMPFVVSSQLLHYLYAKNNEWEKMSWTDYHRSNLFQAGFHS